MNFSFDHGFGVLNAWWFLAVYLAIVVIQPRCYLNGREIMKRLTAQPPRSRTDAIMQKIGMALYFASLLYSVLLPLPVSSINFKIGTAIFVLSMGIYAVAIHHYATTPFDQPVVRGAYRISRNPVHFFSYIAWIGVGLAAGSFLLIGVTLLLMINMHRGTLAEEKFCLEKYGESYREYMKKVPRYFLFF